MKKSNEMKVDLTFFLRSNCRAKKALSEHVFV